EECSLEKASKENRGVELWNRLAKKIEERTLEKSIKENRRAYFGMRTIRTHSLPNSQTYENSKPTHLRKLSFADYF
ncbi:2736_t:CDS:1, partial [Funneliformis caledonium]